MKKTTLFKKLVKDDEILLLPGAYDALSAKIIEQAGFKAVTLGGYPASGSLLAKPDVSLLTMTVIIMGGIYSGFFTPTEAGAVALLYSVSSN